MKYTYDSAGYLVKKTVTVGSNVTVYKTEYPENASPVTRVTDSIDGITELENESLEMIKTFY